MTPFRLPLIAAATVAAALSSPTAHAARPLGVDDTGTNEVGAGHVEAWVARAGGTNTFNVSPAYAVFERFEVVATFAREQSSGVEATTLQVRWTVTEPREQGCNLGASGGSTSVSDGGGREDFAYGMFSCTFGAAGTTHSNLGVKKARGGSSATTWGVAYERAIGPVTPHVEVFGEKGAKPTTQVGLRGTVGAAWQFDGSVGRNEGTTLYTLGLKYQF